MIPPYAEGSDGEHFAGFCETLTQTTDAFAGQPLSLEDFQRRIFDEALSWERNEEGIGVPVWHSVVLVIPRKSGKTTMMAAYALYRLLFLEGDPTILLAATSDAQADHLFQTCAKFVRLSPEISQVCRVRDHVGVILRSDGLGQIRRMQNDPRRLHGYNPSLVVADELAQWTTPTLRRAFEALTSGGAARRAPQVFTISTAGEAHERDSSVLGSMLDRAFERGEVECEPGLRISRFRDAQMLVYNYEAPTRDPFNTAAVKLANPASWVTEQYLRKQAENPELSESAFMQLHACVWAEREDAFLPAGVWEKLAAPREVGDTPVVFGFDGSDRNDSTALVGCTIEDKPYLWVEGVWEKPEHGEGWVVPREEVRLAVDRAMERYDVKEFVADPPGWHREIGEWEEAYDTVTVMFPTNRRKLMSEACSKFHTAVVHGDISHDGGPALTRHLANAVVKETVDGRYITKDHAASERKIDLAVAAIVAYARASAGDQRSVYEEQGLLIG